MRYIKIILPILLFAALYCFWALAMKGALAYQEQYQLFLTTHEYFIDRLWMIGGVGIYLSEFLVQFYNNYWIGAAIVAALLLFAQIATWQICKWASGGKAGFASYALSYATPLAMWLTMGDVDIMPSYILAIDAALAAAWGFFAIKSWTWRIIYAICALPLYYWWFGPTTYFFRVPAIMPTMLWILPLIITMVIFASILLAKLGKWVGSAILLVLLVLTLALYPLCYNAKAYELIDYDYMVRSNNWDGIIKKAEKQHPDLPLSVSSTNLALGMKGVLDDRAFLFYQNGAEGLLPPFKKEAITSLNTAEIYFQLGLINTAQRFYFEGMEAIPNYNKSSRAIKRLAETNLLRGNYQVARKYLNLLEHTLMYKKWAQRTLQLVDNPSLIDKHPLYGPMRERMLDEQYFYSEAELDKILGQLVMKDSGNMLALQYFLMYPLLQRDLDKFMQYVQVIQQRMPYKSGIMQQGVVFAMMKAGMEIPPGMVDPAIMSRFRSYAQTASQHGDLSPYRNTLWYYLTNNE